MIAYLLRRLILIVPTLFGILVLNFFIIQVAPGGPVEQLLAKIQGQTRRPPARPSPVAAARCSSSGGGTTVGGTGRRAAIAAPAASTRRSSTASTKYYGFDKPIYERFFIMLQKYATFDFGKSFFRDTASSISSSRRCRSRSRSACGRR